MTNVSPDIWSVSESENRRVLADFTGDLAESELLSSGQPSVIEIAPSGPTISAISVNSAVEQGNARRVQIRKGVVFFVSGVTAGITYTVDITTAPTSAGQTITGKLFIRGIVD